MAEAMSELKLREYAPMAQVKARRTTVTGPAVRAIDIHNHLGRWLHPRQEWMCPDVDELVALMDDCRIETVVNLDGRWGEQLDDNLARYDLSYPGRFATFAQLDWSRLRADDPSGRLVADLERARDQGARGIKVWKDLGLSVTDAAGDRVLPDDPRLADVFTAAGELRLPVLIHTADPLAFFAPLDRHNERVEELCAHPDWWFGGEDQVDFDTLLESLESLVRRSPGTTFVGAHVGCYAEDLDWVSGLLRDCPNFHVDLGGRLGEIGRQPRRFRQLVVDHPRQVLFGTDCFPLDAETVRAYVRFLETADECFAYAPGCEVPPQGRWDINGAELPADVLPAVYAENARRILALSAQSRAETPRARPDPAQ
jgi:predicted TIM-barrel fold metal-dependent hydrolase